MKALVLGAALLLDACIGTAALAQEAGADAGMIRTCESCHGPNGNSIRPLTPRLNGQAAGYIVNRLRELTDLTQNSFRATMAMHDTAAMKDSDRTALAGYFSRQAPTPAKPQAGKIAMAGRHLYENGDPARNLPACQSCHGANGEGGGTSPRLSGQRRDYLKAQLWDFNFAQRENAVMHPVGLKLEADEIDALAAWLGAD